MQAIFTKTRLIALTFIGATTLTVACSPAISNQNQGSNTNATETSGRRRK